jgi:hypothetical protein
MTRMEYDYTAPHLVQPTPAQVKGARLDAGHTQAHAAALVHKTDSAQWRAWEREGPSGRVIDLAIFELYLIKAGLRVYTEKNNS